MSRRLYSLLLWCLPAPFRRSFGAGMVAAFEDSLIAARAANGRRGALATWRFALADLCRTSVSLWRDARRRRRSHVSAATPKSDPYQEPSRISPPEKEPMTTLVQDIKYALRSLRNAPGFTVVSVLTLALGIGAVTAIFSVVNGVLLRPLPYDDPDQLALLWSRNPTQGQERYFVSPQNFADWRAQNGSFEALASYWPTHNTLTEPDRDAARLRAAMISGDFFHLLGAEPHLGRLFGPEDEGPEAAYTAVISHSLWSNRFSADEDVVGEAIILDGNPVEVIGVTEPGFAFPEDTEVWVNITWDVATGQSRYARWMSLVGRLRQDTNLVAAQADMDVVTTRLAEEYPGPNRGWSSTMSPMHEEVVGNIGAALFVLLGATGLILLIACANVANLQLSRAETRQREVAVRAALGAARGRIARQLVTESLVLAVLGAILGIAMAWAALQLLVAVSPANLPRIEEIRIDGLVLLFASLSTAVTGILFGLAPALRLVGTDMNESLKEGNKGTAGGEKLRLRSSFVIVEVALAVMLVIGAGLLIRSFGNLRGFDPGFRSGNVLTVMLDLPGSTYADNSAVAQLYGQLEERLLALPDVESASSTSTLPLGESVDYYSSFTFPHREPPPPGEQNQAYFRQVGHDFFRVMGVQLLAGRSFTERDREDAPGVVVINETLAKQYWPDSDPIGDYLTNTAGTYGPLGSMLKNEVEIIGVVQDIRYVGLREAPQPSLYFPLPQAPFRRMTMIVRTAGEPAALAGSVRAAVAEIDPELPLSRLATMEQVLSRSVAQERFTMLLLLLFGASALVLATVGIYGVLAYNVEQRTRELGIRIALGAAAGEVRGLVLKQATAMIGLGIGVGLVAALGLSRVLESQLVGVGARDPLTFAAVAALLTAVAFAAAYLPARRATSVNPIVALRNE